MKGSEYAAKTWNIVFKSESKQTIKNLSKFCRETGFKLGKDFNYAIRYKTSVDEAIYKERSQSFSQVEEEDKGNSLC